jgi:hypothetical protein
MGNDMGNDMGMADEMNARYDQSLAEGVARLHAVLESRISRGGDGRTYHAAHATYAKEVPATARDHPEEDELILEVIGPEWAGGGNGRYSLALTDGYKTWYLAGKDASEGQVFLTLEEIVEQFPGLEWHAAEV